MASESIFIDETDNEKVNKILKDGVFSYNAPYFGIQSFKPFTIYIRNTNSGIIGGLNGDYANKYMFVDYLWVDEKFRNQGLGTILIRKLESFSRGKGCSYILLDTYDFQARPFYEKLGFECVGTIKWFGDRDRHFMKKIVS